LRRQWESSIRSRSNETDRDCAVDGLDRHLGAELVQRQALDQRIAAGRGDVEQGARFACENKEIVKQSALRREQGGEAEAAGFERLQVVGEKVVEEGPPVRTLHPDQGAFRQASDMDGHPPNLGRSQL
jgi:hypothetical protein